MIESGARASGGGAGTNGGALRRPPLLWLALGGLGFAAIQAIANVESTRADFARTGVSEPAWHVWVWELSSLAVWLALIPLIWWLVAQVRPPRRPWPLVLLTHAAATLPVSGAHVLGMIALRMLAYGMSGAVYTFGSLSGMLLYEYRKDAATYILVAAFLVFVQWFVARRPANDESEVAAEPELLVVTDGTVTHRLQIDAIDWAASAGNYVEIASGARTVLHRSTLVALAGSLGPGFVRIHRGRLVRRSAVRQVETDRSGDFNVTLASGAVLRGSRRYRSGV